MAGIQNGGFRPKVGDTVNTRYGRRVVTARPLKRAKRIDTDELLIGGIVLAVIFALSPFILTIGAMLGRCLALSIYR